jgi:hypothetical protein
MADEQTEDVTGPVPEGLEESPEDESADSCLSTLTHDEYAIAQDAFPGFVDEEGNETDDDVREGDSYAGQ